VRRPPEKLEQVLKNLDVGAKRGLSWRVVSGLLVTAALLSSCGGEQVEKFVPARVMAFGDEFSVIDDGSTNSSPGVSPGGGTGNGAKYTVNGNDGKCETNPIWIQIVASGYGNVFQQCRGTPLAGARIGRTWAVPNARVGDGTANTGNVDDQIEKFLDVDNFTNSDLVLMLAGLHDVLDLYVQYDSVNAASSRAALTAQASAAGTRLGNLVVQITASGARVAIAVVPDVGRSPYAVREDAAHPGEGRKDVLTALTTSFNSALQAKLNDVRGGGHLVALVLSATLHRGMYDVPTAYPPMAVSDATLLSDSAVLACSIPGGAAAYTPSPAAPPAPSKTCVDGTATTTTTTTAFKPVTDTYLWADFLRYGIYGHYYLGNAAAGAIARNPF
jgi:hypothetical protein